MSTKDKGVRMKDFLRRQILKILFPLIKFIGKLHFPYTHKWITGKHYFDLRDSLKPGMVFLTRTRGEITNLFIPSFWTHAAIYVGNGYVVEAIGRGVSKTDIITFMLTKDYISVYTPKGGDPQQMNNAVVWACEKLNTPYDYFFEGSDKAFYCVELVLDSYKRKGKDDIWVPDIITDENKWDKIWSSKDGGEKK